MQISFQEVLNTRKSAGRAQQIVAERPVRSVADLAGKYGVNMEEVRRHTESVLLAEGDLLRERRLQEIARRVAEGAYRVEAEQVVDMACRRALADRAAEL